MGTVVATLSGVLLMIVYYIFPRSPGRYEIPDQLTLRK